MKATPTHTPPSDPKDCPVVKQAGRVYEQATNLRAAINQLRVELERCETCPLYEQCQPMRQLNSQIDAAVDAVTAEWGLH